MSNYNYFFKKTNPFIKEQYVLSTLKEIKNLSDTNKDVNSWYSSMKAWKELHKIYNPRKFYMYCQWKVEGDTSFCLSNLLNARKDGSIIYPTLEEMKEAFLVIYKLKYNPKDIIHYLKRVKIEDDESIVKFSNRYEFLYNKLPDKYAKKITTIDFMKSIDSRSEFWSLLYTFENENPIRRTIETIRNHMKGLIEFSYENLCSKSVENTGDAKLKEELNRGYILDRTDKLFYFSSFNQEEKEKEDKIYIEINKVYFDLIEDKNDTIKGNASEEITKENTKIENKTTKETMKKNTKIENKKTKETMEERAKIENSQIKKGKVEDHERRLNNLNSDNYIHKACDQVQKQVIKMQDRNELNDKKLDSPKRPNLKLKTRKSNKREAEKKLINYKPSNYDSNLKSIKLMEDFKKNSVNYLQSILKKISYSSITEFKGECFSRYQLNLL